MMTEERFSCEFRPLSDIAEVRLGRQRSPKNHSGPRMRPYLRAANVTWAGVDLSDVKLMNFTETESETFSLATDDILVVEASGSASEVGKVALWAGQIPDCCFQNTLIRVRAHEGVFPRYLFHFLSHQAQLGLLGKASRGVGIHHIGRKRLSEWPVPLPALDIQKKISADLDDLQSHISVGESYLESARRRLIEFEGVAAQNDIAALTTQERTLGELATDIRYGTSVKCSYEGLGPPVLRIPNVRGGRMDTVDVKFAIDGNDALPSHQAEPGDLLFIRTNGSPSLIGRCAVVEQPGYAFASYLIRVRLDRSVILPEYVSLVAGSPAMRATIERSASSSAGQMNLNSRALRELVIPVPSMEEQRMAITQHSKRTSQIGDLGRSLLAAREQASSLAQGAFAAALQSTHGAVAGGGSRS